MERSAAPQDGKDSRRTKLVQSVRRSFVEFLGFPSLLIVGFLCLAAITSVLDFERPAWLEPLRLGIGRVLFGEPEATSALLGTIAGSIITVTSITFSLLLLAVQQAAAALTPLVYDQFLRRRINQMYFGFFVGLALYTLVILASVNGSFNPVIGGALALLLTLVALVLIILLLYTTVNQMRPVDVVETIHDHVLAARANQFDLLGRTRAKPRHERNEGKPVRSRAHGYVVRIDLDTLAAAAKRSGDAAEIVLHVAIGDYVAFADILASIHAPDLKSETVAQAVRASVRLEQQRDIDTDAAYGIEQLTMIGWTSVSTAKSNPEPGALVLHSLRDLMARWSVEQSQPDAEMPDEKRVPVVYTDNVFALLLGAFENLAVVASESMQPQTVSEFVHVFALMFRRLPAEHRPRAEDLIRRSLSALGEHVLTTELGAALDDLASVLDADGRSDTATEVRTARDALAASIGKLGARSTRASGSA